MGGRVGARAARRACGSAGGRDAPVSPRSLGAGRCPHSPHRPRRAPPPPPPPAPRVGAGRVNPLPPLFFFPLNYLYYDDFLLIS